MKHIKGCIYFSVSQSWNDHFDKMNIKNKEYSDGLSFLYTYLSYISCIHDFW